MSRSCGGAPGGWCPPTEQVAKASWEYAQLAQNAYWQTALESDKPRDEQYVLPRELKERYASADDERGYAYSVFDRFEPDPAGQERLAETVLVFRGTEGPKDWWYGNILGKQGKRGFTTYRQLRAGMDEVGYAEVPITLAGHSLGGRIADEVLERLAKEPDGIPAHLGAYLFNATAISPELREGVGDAAALPPRIAISEAGEIAGILRLADNGADWDGYAIDCQPGFSLIESHYMRGLADCLTWIAARDDPAAARSVERNEIGAPKAEERAVE